MEKWNKHFRYVMAIEILPWWQFRRSLASSLSAARGLSVDLLPGFPILMEGLGYPDGRRDSCHAVRVLVGNRYPRSILYVHRPL